MPALFAYLIAVALLLGGGYGALNWLAAPEPMKVVAKAKPKPAPPRYADDNGASTPTNPPQAGLTEAAKPEAISKPEVGTDQVKTASNEAASSSNEAASSDQKPPASSSSQPQQPATAGQQDAKAAATAPAQQPDRSAQAEISPAAADQGAGHAAAPVPGTSQDHSAPANQEEKQSAQAVSPGAISPGIAQSVASAAPASAAIPPKRPHVRQASRRSDKRPLEVMTLRTIELPDGRRMTQLVPYRRSDRYRDDAPAMAFDPDE
ncbi:hypothetical protein [Bradyrhizobium erythrophlei]|jgi:hypothetical protein|uniref:Uncharacterized protein n=1 Tax=Bradyrhizobium erythrophlei TaxID=1437360 RepID=A0A1M5V002_9BRAD|nr:hypothetical protein [Bradyrhizobium erythrophlei]SHH68490.1 hypothetical protein SAMN05444169_8783 [Bradyrhizobium erythrophlei]